MGVGEKEGEMEGNLGFKGKEKIENQILYLTIGLEKHRSTGKRKRNLGLF